MNKNWSIIILFVISLGATLAKAKENLPAGFMIASLEEVVGKHVAMTEWRVAPDSLKAQCKWDGTSAPAPLSSYAAIAIALKREKQLYPGIKDWIVEAIHMQNIGSREQLLYQNVWYYQITIIPKDDRLRSKIEDHGTRSLTQVVLMDGTLVEPAVVYEPTSQNQ